MDLALLIKRIAMNFGVDVRAYSPARSEAARLAKLLENHQIDLVLDVGANTGQYARYLRSIGYQGRIVCFEPQNDAYALLKKYAENDSRITVAPQMALGDAVDVATMYVSANSESSSLLKVTDKHIDAEPDVKTVTTEKVQINRLDMVSVDYVSESRGIFLKIDTQGYEVPVLQGATGLLPIIKGMQIELSLVPLYEGELLYREIIELVESAGFALYDLNPCFSDSKTGRTYQLDGIFFRE